MGHPSHSRLEELLHGSVTNDILRKMPQVDLYVVGGGGKAAANDSGVKQPI